MQAAFPDACFICVPDTVAALPALAAGFRAAHLPALRVIAVTGSVGKTTTKTLCAAVLRAAFPTFAGRGTSIPSSGCRFACRASEPTCARQCWKWA